MGAALVLGSYGMFATDSFQFRTSLTKPGLSVGERCKRLWYALAWLVPLCVELLNPGNATLPYWPLAALLLLAVQYWAVGAKLVRWQLGDLCAPLIDRHARANRFGFKFGVFVGFDEGGDEEDTAQAAAVALTPPNEGEESDEDTADYESDEDYEVNSAEDANRFDRILGSRSGRRTSGGGGGGDYGGGGGGGAFSGAALPLDKSDGESDTDSEDLVADGSDDDADHCDGDDGDNLKQGLRRDEGKRAAEHYMWNDRANEDVLKEAEGADEDEGTILRSGESRKRKIVKAHPRFRRAAEKLD